jgi:hypothetical protein
MGDAQLDLFAPNVAPSIPSPSPSLSVCPPFLSHPLPEHIRTLSLHRPYAGLVKAGLKMLETRKWEWPRNYGPGWLLIHESKKIDKEAIRRIGNVAQEHVGIGGVAVVLVWIEGSRMMVAEDEERAMIGVAEGRWVWGIGERHPLITPIPMVGKQKFWPTPREDVLAALAA